MVVTQLSEEKLRQIEADLAPDVIRIRASVGEDWAGRPAAFFRVILADAASRPDRLKHVVQAVRNRIEDKFSFDSTEMFPFIRFRSESEQAGLREEAWN